MRRGKILPLIALSLVGAFILISAPSYAHAAGSFLYWQDQSGEILYPNYDPNFALPYFFFQTGLYTRVDYGTSTSQMQYLPPDTYPLRAELFLGLTQGDYRAWFQRQDQAKNVNNALGSGVQYFSAADFSLSFVSLDFGDYNFDPSNGSAHPRFYIERVDTSSFNAFSVGKAFGDTNEEITLMTHEGGGWGNSGGGFNFVVYLKLGDTPVPTINFSYPTDQATLLFQDFSFWWLTAKNISPDTYTLRIDYWKQGATSTLVRDERNYTSITSTENLFYRGKLGALDGSTLYRTRAQILNVGGEIVADTGEISFLTASEGFVYNTNIDEGFGVIVQEPESADYSFVDQDFGFLGNLFRDLLKWLFIPPQESLAMFGSLFSVIQDKPPIGYFYATKDALSDVAETSTRAFALLNASSTEMLETGVFSALRTGIAGILWLSFGMWAFFRIKHLDL